MIEIKCSAVVFDLGMVLLNFDYKIMIERLEKVEPGLGNHFIENYKSNYDVHRNFERGKISETDFVEEMLNSLNHKIDAETFCKFYSEIFTLNEKVAGLLPVLKNKYRLFLLSNTNSIHQKYGWKDYPFLVHFEKQFLSHEVGAVKPDEKIYRAVEKYSCLPPEEHIFIDDIKEYADAAKNLGWDAIHFTGYDDLIKNLKAKGILD